MEGNTNQSVAMWLLNYLVQQNLQKNKTTISISDLIGTDNAVLRFGRCLSGGGRRIFRSLGEECSAEEWKSYYLTAGDTVEPLSPITCMEFLREIGKVMVDNVITCGPIQVVSSKHDIFKIMISGGDHYRTGGIDPRYISEFKKHSFLYYTVKYPEQYPGNYPSDTVTEKVLEFARSYVVKNHEGNVDQKEADLIKAKADLIRAEADLIKAKADLIRAEADLIRANEKLSDTKKDLGM
jgi:hypothetical protein